MGDFEWLGSYEAWIASEVAQGSAIRVPDDAMHPILQTDDIVRVERRHAEPGEIVCVRSGTSHIFGVLSEMVVSRTKGSSVLLTGREHILGVVTAVIDRDLLSHRD